MVFILPSRGSSRTATREPGSEAEEGSGRGGAPPSSSAAPAASSSCVSGRRRPRGPRGPAGPALLLAGGAAGGHIRWAAGTGRAHDWRRRALFHNAEIVLIFQHTGARRVRVGAASADLVCRLAHAHVGRHSLVCVSRSERTSVASCRTPPILNWAKRDTRRSSSVLQVASAATSFQCHHVNVMKEAPPNTARCTSRLRYSFFCLFPL